MTQKEQNILSTFLPKDIRKFAHLHNEEVICPFRGVNLL